MAERRGLKYHRCPQVNSNRGYSDYTVSILKSYTTGTPPCTLFCVCISAHLLTCCLSMTQFTHWVLFDSAAVVVAAVEGYRPPTHQPPHRPKVLIGEVPASSFCSGPLHHCTLLNLCYGTSSCDGDQNGRCDSATCFVNLLLTMGRV